MSEKTEIKKRLKQIDSAVFEIEKKVHYAFLIKWLGLLKEKVTLERELETVRQAEKILDKK